MKQLKDILYKVAIESVSGTTFLDIDHLTFDSREVTNTSVFIAIKGTQVDGHDYILKAIESGACAVLCETVPEQLISGVTYIQVLDTHLAVAQMADNFYDHPSAKLKLVGVTGTNGKTTVASLLYQLFTNLGYQVGLLSTVKVTVGKEDFVASHTTPDSISINRWLHQMVEQGCEYCFMEVSSHGIVQKRTSALQFAGGVFTNLSHDHLDYHKTFAEYRDAKKIFFDQLPQLAFAITNQDDKNGPVMVQNTKAKIKTYALKSMADYRAQILESQFSGMLMRVNNHEIWVQLIGDFNAYNLLAVYAAATELGVSEQEALIEISKLQSVAGRFQYIVVNQITAIVDYAHTPDALENVIKTINSIRTYNETLLTVVGCGGNRDKTKRPLMAQIATAESNKVILTSDNPRFEDPYEILKEMEQGVELQNQKKVLVIEDRKQAIKTACQLAQTGDIILIAGKGHETYQEIQGVRTDFNDLMVVKEYLEQLSK